MNLISNAPLEPFDLVLFGATGDLALRSLYPALYYRHREGQLPEDGRILGAARSEYTDEAFREMLTESVRQHIPDEQFDADSWSGFLERVHYRPVDVTTPAGYDELGRWLEGREDRVRLFYLSVAPSLFVPITRGVHDAGLITPASRVALEKPLGRDRESAEAINDELAEVFDESQIYRIDHYLGKETVQNLLALRFGNTIFEPLWRSEAISDVQITIAEAIGVGTRGAFYDQTGALRDMVQNHLLQLLVIIAMEPPVSMEPDAVRDEKIKVLRALAPLVGAEAVERTVRGQYKPGKEDGEAVPGYVELDDVPEDSTTETFVAIRATINSWRWAGVPFYLRTGKRLERKLTEIIVNFRKPPHEIFPSADGFSTPNQLVIRLQPEESVTMRIYIKAAGDDIELQPVTLNLDFNDVFRKRRMIAYERLLLDMIRGNQTLFMRRDEVAAAWAWIDPIRAAWDRSQTPPRQYAPGSWGPSDSTVLPSRDGNRWFED